MYRFWFASAATERAMDRDRDRLDMGKSCVRAAVVRAANSSVRAASTWEIGSPFELKNPEGKVQAEGSIISLDPPHKLVLSWRMLINDDTASENPSRITWEIDPHAELDGVTLVTVIHDEFEQAKHTANTLKLGLPIVLSGLKTLLETGSTLTSP